MLGYPTGLQLWDCSNLGSVSELLNLTGPEWGAVEFAGVLPDPLDAAGDLYRQKRPLIGFSWVSSVHVMHGRTDRVRADRALRTIPSFLYIRYALTKSSSGFL